MKEATRLYIGTHNGVRVLDVTSNGGEVNRVGALTLDHAAARVSVSGSSAGRVYLAAYESGLWRSDDGGATWHELKSYPEAYAHSVVVDPEDGDLIYAGAEPAAPLPLHRRRRVLGGVPWLCRYARSRTVGVPRVSEVPRAGTENPARRQ